MHSAKADSCNSLDARRRGRPPVRLAGLLLMLAAVAVLLALLQALPVLAGAGDATGQPSIFGPTGQSATWIDVRVSETLTAYTFDIADEDGLANVEFNYQWIRSDETADNDIDGETASTYVLSDDDVGKTIKVRVTFTDDAGNEELLISEATTAVLGRYNRPAYGGAWVSGIPRLGLTLGAATSDIGDADGLTNATFSYQWIRNDGDADTDIKDATGLTYRVSDDDVGKSIKVRVSFTDDAGNEEVMTSAAKGVVLAPYRPNTPATGEPTISGPAHVGETLTADISGIDDADRLSLIDKWYSGHTFRYQWVAGGSDIDGPTGASYTLKSSEMGKNIQVRVSFTDDWGHKEAVTSAATEVVTARPNAPATGAPTISGTRKVGETLTAATSGIADDDGLLLTNATFSYQWVAGGSDIDEATGASYTLTASEQGKTIQVRVSFTDDWGNGETLTSAATEAVNAKPNTPAIGLPTISGPSHVGETLTAEISGIADFDGLTNTTFSYQWIRNDGSTVKDIEDETEPTYGVVDADVGKTIKVRVSFTDDWGEGETLTSAAILAVASWVAQERPIWSADMTVLDLGNGSIGAFNANLFSNQKGTAGLQAKWLWYYTPTRKLTLAFTDGVPGTEELTLQFGDVALSLQGGDSSFAWEDVDVDWEGGEVIPVRIVRTSAAANTPAAGAPTISGTVQVGETLTADTSGIADEDGLTNATFSYQWIANDGNADADIEDETSSTFELSNDDFGKNIKVRVSFADDAGLAESLTSEPTAAVIAKPNSPATGAPSINGTAHIGYTLTADTSGITDEDGLTNATFSYQWIANDGNADLDIEDGTGSTYELSSDEVGKSIKVRVSFADDAGRAESLTSEPTLAVTWDNYAAAGAPTISGTAQMGETLTAETAGITDWDGLDNVSYSYQWMRVDGVTDAEITEATDSTYELGVSDKGKSIKVRVSFADDVGYEESLTGEPTAKVTDDHGDTPEDATDLPINKQVQGEIKPYEDVDYFRIEIEPEQAGYITIWWSEAIRSRDRWRRQLPYAHYALFDSDGVCATRYCEAGGGHNDNSPTLRVPLEAGTYYLRVTGPPSSEGVDPNPERRDYSVVWEWSQDNFNRRASRCQTLDDDKYDDPLYGCQNSLKNRKHPGEDINVEPAWDDGVLGAGIKVVVVDNWIDDLHQDLLGAVDVEKGETGYYSDRGIDLYDDHGIMVAGIIAAQHNSTGVRGIAPKSTLFNFTVTQKPENSLGGDISFFGDDYFRAMTLAHREVAVSNNSWGLVGFATNPHSMPGGLRDGIQKGIKQGFGGKGISYIFGTSNHGRNSNLSGLENYYAVTTVCGVSETGESMEEVIYGVTGGYGSNLWVCAPTDHLTTVHNDYYATRRGVSSATPAVSGVVALIRSANRDLTWRDVKVILADSARQNDPEHAGWTTGAAKYGSPTDVYRYNERYGFGVVDAGAAVEMAKAWDLLPPMKTASAESGSLDLTIPDVVDGAEPTTVSSTLALDTAIGFVEFVEVSIEFDHPSFPDLEVEIVSPRGTVSMLTNTSCCSSNPEFRGTHRFGSAKNLGEDPTGTWTMRLTDHVNGQEGGIKNWSIKVYGHEVASAQGLPTIDGTARVGETLTALTNDITDSDGLTNVSYSYQWIRSDNGTEADIAGQTDSTYTLVAADQGRTIKVRVSFTDDADDAGTLTSAATGVVEAKPNSPATGAPILDGTAQVGETLTADTANIADQDGLAGVSYRYQWIRNDGNDEADIEDATVSTYTLVSADQGKTIKVRVTFTDDADNEETLTSAATVAVTAKPNTAATGLPTITGTPQVSETLTADTSVIDDEDGLDGVSYNYQWMADDVNIDGANTSTYVPADGDAGKAIKVSVSFTDDRNNAEARTSVATKAVTATVPTQPLSLTVATGGQTRELDVSWQAPSSNGGSDVTGYKVQWKEAAGSWDTADDLSEATETGTTHTITSLTGGVEYAVRVIATNVAGDGPASTEVKGTPAGGVSEQNTEPENTAPTGLPTISGTPQVDETLTADTSGIADAEGLTSVSYSYQWIRNDGETDTDLEGATDSTYTPSASDVGKTIKVQATFTDDADNEETLTSAASETVAATKPGAPGHVNVFPHDTGALDVYWETPTSNGGSDVTGYKVQWKESADSWETPADVSEATVTGTTHTITGLTDGVEYTVRVRAVNDVGEGSPSAEASGTPQQAAIWSTTLTVGIVAETFAGYTTFLPDSTVLGALSSDTITLDDASYTVKALGVLNGKLILSVMPKLAAGFVLVVGTDEFASTDASTREGDSVVQFQWNDPGLDLPEGEEVAVRLSAPDDNTPATGEPTISGTAKVGETLTADTSGIGDADGLTNVSYRYQWVVNDGETDADIEGATDSTYTPSVSEVGKTIKVRVTFTDDADNAETLTSAATDTVAATKPGVPGHLNVFPHDTGALDVYWEAPASDGGSAITGYKVQWKETADSWDTPADVSEATASGTIHTITGLTDGVEYTVRVRATNGVGDSLPSAEKPGTPRETQAPQMVRPSVDGATLRVLYDEGLDEGSAPLADAFDVRVACTCDGTTWRDEEAKRAVENVSVDGSTVVLTLVSAATSEDVVVVSYTPPSDAAAARIRDLAGNAADGFNSTEVFNDTDEVAESEEDGEAEEATETDTPLTVSLENSPGSHNGTDVFTFEIRFSEEFGLSYKTLRDDAFTVVGGEVKKAQRMDRDSNTPNIWWLITVEPGGNGDATITLPATTDCTDDGAICTGDGRKLSNSLNFIVSGPGQ